MGINAKLRQELLQAVGLRLDNLFLQSGIAILGLFQEIRGLPDEVLEKFLG